ncbi:gluconokinase [Vogesella sp. AC12]|uniref:gluconokinase n=1 Tax=Vogesella sp. AC12 TaxID=2950550 RepID=UPI00210B72CE|nr:gluconokinase [Vogesella sp. AC12]MCQ4142890.1 gluconokinase [Vogesella sp. AC12]
MNKAPMIVVMGVCGCGKSEIGRRLAAALDTGFVEGDDFHPPHNVARMEAGTPLTDTDRQLWLETLRDKLAAAAADGRGLVLSCSALKRRYRDLLREGAAATVFVHLHGSRALIGQRMQARQGHFMPLGLVDSQFADLQPPAADERAIAGDITLPPDELVRHILQQLAALS